MSLPVRYRPEAETDLEGFVLSYGLHSPDTADDLAHLVLKQEGHISEFPEIGRVFYKNLRAVLIRRFHLLMVYAILPDEIQVVLLVDARSEPRRIRDALRLRAGE